MCSIALLKRRLDMVEDALSSEPSCGLLNRKPESRQCQTISVVHRLKAGQILAQIGRSRRSCIVKPPRCS